MIQYKSHYKYQLAENYRLVLPFAPEKDIRTHYVSFTRDGVLFVRAGYAWDGASGPVVDTKENMRGSLLHDALYQLLRMGLLPLPFRDLCDMLFRDITIEDGVNKWRAYAWYYGLKWFAIEAALPKSKKKVRIAP